MGQRKGKNKMKARLKGEKEEKIRRTKQHKSESKNNGDKGSLGSCVKIMGIILLLIAGNIEHACKTQDYHWIQMLHL